MATAILLILNSWVVHNECPKFGRLVWKDQRGRQENVLILTESTLLRARITIKYRRPNFGQRFNWIWMQDSKMILLLSQNLVTSCLSNFSNLSSKSHGGQNKKEYIIKFDTAKEIT